MGDWSGGSSSVWGIGIYNAHSVEHELSARDKPGSMEASVARRLRHTKAATMYEGVGLEELAPVGSTGPAMAMLELSFGCCHKQVVSKADLDQESKAIVMDHDQWQTPHWIHSFCLVAKRSTKKPPWSGTLRASNSKGATRVRRTNPMNVARSEGNAKQCNLEIGSLEGC
jgi:hypothetical protein